jgi:hypothetical protein
MKNDYECILICAIRYALGRQTYMVEVVTNYIINEIPKLTNKCKDIMIRDIENPLSGYGASWDKEK